MVIQSVCVKWNCHLSTKITSLTCGKKRNFIQVYKPRKFNLWWKLKVLSFIEKVPTWFLWIFIQMRNWNCSVLINPNGMILIGQNCSFWFGHYGAALIGQIEQMIQLHSSDWMWQVSVHWSKDDIRNFHVRIDSEFRNREQEAGSSLCSFSLKSRMCERPLSTWLQDLDPVNPEESLVDILLLKVHILYMFLKSFNF